MTSVFFCGGGLNRVNSPDNNREFDQNLARKKDGKYITFNRNISSMSLKCPIMSASGQIMAVLKPGFDNLSI